MPPHPRISPWLAGGDKSTPARDIKRARGMVRERWESEARGRMPKTSKQRKRLGIAPFEPFDYSDNGEVIAKYLAAALEDPNPDVFLHALADVAKARGISKVAKEAGVGRESLYKALAPGAKIRYETVRKLLTSLGLRLTVRTP
jgi:probable addiction module antidote protein